MQPTTICLWFRDFALSSQILDILLIYRPLWNFHFSPRGEKKVDIFITDQPVDLVKPEWYRYMVLTKKLNSKEKSSLNILRLDTSNLSDSLMDILSDIRLGPLVA